MECNNLVTLHYQINQKNLVMKTIEVTVYQFSELSDEAKEKAIQRLSDINVHFEWWDCTYEDAKSIGLNIISFDHERYLNGEFTLSACEVAQNILNSHGDHCETFETAKDFLDEWNPIFADYMDEHSENYESGDLEDTMMDLEQDFLESLCEDYRIMLSKEYEYRTSEEAIIEAIESNEYQFTQDGKLF